jgi:hypothetical protein
MLQVLHPELACNLTNGRSKLVKFKFCLVKYVLDFWGGAEYMSLLVKHMHRIVQNQI